MDSNSGTGATPSGGMTQAQANNLTRIGIPSEIINDIYQAKLPDSVLSKLETVNSPQQLVDEVGTLWLSAEVVEKIRRIQPAGTTQGYGAPPTPPSGYAQPPQTQAQTPPGHGSQQQYNYGQPTQPTPPNYGQPAQGGYAQPGAPPPGGYQYPQQQYPQQGYGQAPYPAPQPQAAPKKGGVPAIVWILGGVLLTIVLCVVAVFAILAALGNAVVNVANTAGALGVASTFTTSMSSGDYAGARNLLSGDLANRYTEATLESRWIALVGEDNTFNVNSDLGTPRQDGNRTVVPWTIEGQNGKQYKVDLYLTSLSSSSTDSILQIVDAKPDLIPSP